MTYLQILNTIKDIALAQPNVNSVVREFLDLNREDAKYSAVVIQDRDGSRDRIVEQDYITYTWHLGYVDRLTYDESNRDDIISTGINIINNIVNTIRNTWFPELEVSVIDRINTFDQRFTAQCAGVYVVLAVNAQVSDCIDSESTDLYDTYDAKITANGVYHFVPSGRPVDEINITVDVAGLKKEEVSLTDTVTMNGTHTYIPAEDTVYKDVELTVDVHPTERLVQTYTTNGTKTITGEFNGGEITVDVDTDTVWGSITGNITDQTDLVDYVTGKDNDIKTWVSSQGYLTEHQTLKTINGESIVGEGNIVINSPDLTGYATESWVENNMEQKKQVFNISIDLDGPGVRTSYDEYMNIAAYVRNNGIDAVRINLVDISGQVFPVTSIDVNAQNMILTAIGSYYSFDKMYIRISDNNSQRRVVISAGNLVDGSWVLAQGYATQTWVNNKGYLTEHQTLKTINGESIVGEGNIVITGGGSEEVILIPFDGDQLSLTHQELVDNVLNKIDGKPVGSYRIFFVNGGVYYYEADTIFLNHNVMTDSSTDDTSVYISSTGGAINITLQFFLKNETVDFYRSDLAFYSEIEYLTEQLSTLESRIPDLTGYATQSWVTNQGYITSIPDTYATKSWVSSQGYLTSLSLNGYATESWVTNQGYITSIPDTYATKSWVSEQGYLTSLSLTGYATESWVSSQGYITSIPDTFATKTWVSEQGYLVNDSIDPYATCGWVQERGYITESWVSSQQFATQSWVSSQGYLTEHQDLSSYALKSEIPSLDGYATESWATSQFLEESKVWTGTQSAWDALTSSQQATYTIALITE